MSVGRREFIKLGLTGSAVLATGASVAWLSGCAPADGPAPGYDHLRARDLALLAPLIPVLLEGSERLQSNPERPLKALDQLLASHSAGGRKQYFQLLDLLQLGAVRWYFTGHWSAFGEQDPETLRDTVRQWSRSDAGLARLALRAISLSTMLGWYAQTDIGMTTGYPGPPRKVT